MPNAYFVFAFVVLIHIRNTVKISTQLLSKCCLTCLFLRFINCDAVGNIISVHFSCKIFGLMSLSLNLV